MTAQLIESYIHKGESDPDLGHVIFLEGRGSPLIYCGKFKGSWILFEEDRTLFGRSPLTASVVRPSWFVDGGSVIDEDKAKSLSEALIKRPTPGSHVKVFGENAIYLRPGDEISIYHRVAVPIDEANANSVSEYDIIKIVESDDQLFAIMSIIGENFHTVELADPSGILLASNISNAKTVKRWR